MKSNRYLAAGPLLAVGVIVLAVVPWWSFRDHSHWEKVEWLPFTSPVFRLRDFVANVLLFVPLGMVVARRSASQRRVVNAAAIGAALSLIVELAQVYSHSRFPTATDVLANVLGAAVAATLVRSRS